MTHIQKIKELMSVKNISISQLAKFLNKSERTVYNYLNSSTILDIHTLQTIANSLDVHISFLFDDGNKEIENSNNEMIIKYENLKLEYEKLCIENKAVVNRNKELAELNEEFKKYKFLLGEEKFQKFEYESSIFRVLNVYNEMNFSKQFFFFLIEQSARLKTFIDNYKQDDVINFYLTDSLIERIDSINKVLLQWVSDNRKMIKEFYNKVEVLQLDYNSEPIVKMFNEIGEPIKKIEYKNQNHFLSELVSKILKL